MQRRQFIQTAATLGAVASIMGCATGSGSIPSRARVVVVGGGYGGATAAKYVRMLSDYKIEVVMVEPNASFVSCPISNLVIGGYRKVSDLTTPYNNLSGKHGVTVVRDMVKTIDSARRTIVLAGGNSIAYDKLILT
jgi:sulfide dehydrogenase [flavocytochrome c] flavoprotein chain